MATVSLEEKINQIAGGFLTAGQINEIIELIVKMMYGHVFQKELDAAQDNLEKQLAYDRRQIDEAIRILSIDGINSKQKAKDILRGVRYRGGTQG